jgi:opine dehydrogenase
MFDIITVIGAGNGGKASAADLALRGKRVRLFEFPEYSGNLREIAERKELTATGEVTGQARLEMVTSDLKQAVEGADVLLVCTQALTHARVARELAPLVKPRQVILLNPGSTCGTLEFAHVFQQQGLKNLPILAELSTLTYGCRSSGASAHVNLRVRRVTYGVFPGKAAATVGPEIETLFPGLVRGENVLETGLKNANPIIHPPITMLNAARIEKQGSAMFFYKDGVSPVVARMIEKLDSERRALLGALGYSAPSDPETCVAQGYAESADYLECYGKSATFQAFRSPDTLDHRYFHEDLGIGLVMYCSVGKMLGVPTPACETFVRMGSLIHNVDYFASATRTMEKLGLSRLSVPQLRDYLTNGTRS